MEKHFTILCPTDFSECSLNAIEYAARLGEKYQGRLILFHVLNRDDYQKMSPEDTHGRYQVEFVQEKLNNLQDAVWKESQSKGLQSCEIAIREGEIVHGVLEFAQSIQADLIVAGTEGVNELRENIIGSRASRLVENSDRDILIVPRRVFFKTPRKLVFASDYLEEDKLAIQKIVEMARFYEAEVDFVHVSPSLKIMDKTLHEAMVDELKPFVRYEKVNYVLKSYRDDLALALENYLQVAKGDMLVTLSKKKSFFQKVFTKNLSKKMSYFLSKPLWVIKSF